MEIKEVFGNYVVITPINDKKILGTTGLEGITTQQDKYRRGEVHYFNKELPLKKGDIVIYDKQGTTDLHIGDKKYEVITTREIICTT